MHSNNLFPVAANLVSYCATILQTNQIFQLIQLILSILGTLVLVILKVVQILKDGKVTDKEIDDMIDFFTGLRGDKMEKKSTTDKKEDDTHEAK